MKMILESINIAFSMYSKVPMPQIEWNERNMKYVMCYFPIVGLLIGALQGGMLWALAQYSSISSFLWAAAAVILPIVLTGGIHMDGFCDTMDALGSHQSIEKKLEILKDSNSGAFAVMGCVLFFILNLAVWDSLLPFVKEKGFWTLMLSYTLSRSLSGFSVVTFSCAKNSGLAALFSQAADRKKARTVLRCWVIAVSAVMLLIDFRTGLLCIGTALVIFWYYHHVSMKQFGGITGDLAGFFLQICELAMALTAAAGGM